MNSFLLRFSVFLSILLLASCASPRVMRTTYPDGFTLITRSSGPIQTRHEGRAQLKKADAIGGRKVSFKKNVIVRHNADKVPCSLHDGFGFSVMILGLPDGENELTVEIEHPMFLPPQDRLGTFFSRKDKISSMNAKATWGFVWGFNNEYERVAGKWVVRLKYRDVIIFQESVEVLPLTP